MERDFSSEACDARKDMERHLQIANRFLLRGRFGQNASEQCVIHKVIAVPSFLFIAITFWCGGILVIRN